MSALPLSPLLVRWGKSAYEKGISLDAEHRRVEGLGLRCVHLPAHAPLEALAEANILVVTAGQVVRAAEMDASPRLQLIITTTSGYDHIDIDAARVRGIPVVRLPLARRDAVVEATIGMALSLLRDLPRMQIDAREGRWVRAELPDRNIQRLCDIDVGVIGLGVIGRRLIQVLTVLGTRIESYDPAVSLDPLPQLHPRDMVARCRIVTLHCRREPGAPPVIDREVLSHARPDLILINTARGSVLDLDAAWEALQEGRLGALALDVFSQEPCLYLAALAHHPRVLVTPHAAGYHEGLAETLTDELLSVLRAWLMGHDLPGRVV